MKRLLILAVIVCALCGLVKVNVNAASSIDLYLDEQLVSINNTIKNNNILVPYNQIFKAFGLKYNWDKKTQIITGSNDKYNISLGIGKKTYTVNGKTKSLPIVPQIINGSPMIPLDAMVYAVGYDLVKDNTYSIVKIYTQEPRNNMMFFYTKQEGSSERLYEVTVGNKYVVRGYPDHDKYLIFYEGQYSSYHITIKDNRGLNYKQKIKWNYKGKTYTNTREELYGFFNDTSYLSSRLKIDGSVLTVEWFEKSFGSVYSEWFDYTSFCNDADSIVRKFLQKKEGVVLQGHLADSEDIEFTPSEWCFITELYDNDVAFTQMSISPGKFEYCFVEYSMATTNDDIIFKVSDMTDVFMESKNAEGTFSGIRFKKENNMLYFNRNDLIEMGILNEEFK